MSDRLTIALFRGVTDTRPQPREVTFEELIDLLTTHEERPAADGPGWSPTVYREGATRGNQGVEAITALVLDMDKAPPPDRFLPVWRRYAHVIHTTYSHTEQVWCYRVVFPLAQPVPAAQWGHVWRAFVQLLSAGEADASCKDRARFYFTPACKPGAPRFAQSHAGEWLDPSPFLTPPRATGQVIPVTLSGDQAVPAGVLVSRALSVAAREGRNNGGLWLALQCRDNGYSEAETEAVGLLHYVPAVGLVNTKGDHETYEERHWRATVHSAFTQPAREPWGAASPSAPATADSDGPPALDCPAAFTTRPTRFNLCPLAELMEKPRVPTTYLVDGILPDGGVSMICAKPKVGKSTLARNIAVAVARGEPIFGRGTTQGPVLYFVLEEKEEEILAHFASMGARNEAIYLHVGPSPEEALTALYEAIRHYDAIYAIVDPLQRLLRLKDINDYAEVSNKLEPVTHMARETKCHIQGLHHSGKMLREGGDSVLGSTALFGGVDTLVEMRRRADGIRTVSTIQRYGKDLPETVVLMDEETGSVTLGGDIETLKLERAEVEVLETLAGGPLEEKDLRERIGGNQSLTSTALRRLHAVAKVARTGGGKKGDPYLYGLPTAGG